MLEETLLRRVHVFCPFSLDAMQHTISHSRCQSLPCWDLAVRLTLQLARPCALLDRSLVPLFLMLNQHATKRSGALS